MYFYPAGHETGIEFLVQREAQRSANLIDRLRQDPRFRWEMIVLGCMYIGYAALYMCRKTVEISGPAMLDDPMLGLTKIAWGAILGWDTAGTVAGKLVN